MRGMNSFLDGFLRPFIQGHPTWRLCVFGGMLLGISLAMALAAAVGLSPWVAGGVALAGALVCGLIGLGQLALIGVESYTFYHYQAGVLMATAALLALAGQPVLPYLDVIALALAAALACGRFGCQSAGCCHGRPHAWGVCYPDRTYRALGFPPHLLGVRLFPAQLAEALWLGALVLSGGAMLLAGWPPGSVLAWYALGYGIGRFCLEFWRGDEGRPFLASFSTAQWTCLAWVVGTVAAEVAGVLPLSFWHVMLAGGCLAGALASLRPVARTQRALLTPGHVRELAGALTATALPVPWVAVRHTSAGYRVSGELVENEAVGVGVWGHYTLSRAAGELSAPAARQLAALILLLRHPGGRYLIVPVRANVFHVLIKAGSQSKRDFLRTSRKRPQLSVKR